MSKKHLGIMTSLVVAILTATSSGEAQSGDGLRYRVKYQCKGETVVVDYCRHDSDMAGFPRTIPQNDYCAVDFPDRPLHNGIMVPSSILRSDIVGQLQACGALPRPMGWTPKQRAPVQETTAPDVMACWPTKCFRGPKTPPMRFEQYQKVLTLQGRTPQPWPWPNLKDWLHLRQFQ